MKSLWHRFWKENTFEKNPRIAGITLACSVSLWILYFSIDWVIK